MLYHLKNIAKAAAYASLIWLTWEWFKGDVTWGFSFGCVIISGI